jgi:hypothetical protein
VVSSARDGIFSKKKVKKRERIVREGERERKKD